MHRNNGQILETFTRGVGLAGDIGTLVAVTHHSGSSITPGTYYAHHNHRGDIVLTRSGTNTVGTYSYSAFGNLSSVLGPDVCRFKFSSKERDPSTGFYYYGYRFYAPHWQRWLRPDVIGEKGGMNLYGFTLNNPIVGIDAYGTSVFKWLLAPIMALLEAVIGPLYAHCQTACGYNSCVACCAAVDMAAAALLTAGALGLTASTSGLGTGIAIAAYAISMGWLLVETAECIKNCQSKPSGW